jgi:hypothetical protein
MPVPGVMLFRMLCMASGGSFSILLLIFCPCGFLGLYLQVRDVVCATVLQRDNVINHVVVALRPRNTSAAEQFFLDRCWNIAFCTIGGVTMMSSMRTMSGAVCVVMPAGRKTVTKDQLHHTEKNYPEFHVTLRVRD